MFDDCWWFDGRSTESAGKSTVKILCFCIAKNSAKIQGSVFCQMRREARRWTRGEPPGRQTPPGRGPPLDHAWGPPGVPGSPQSLPFRLYHPSDLKTSGGRFEEIFRCRIGGGNHGERKALRQGEIYLGNSFPEGGNRRHRHRHCHGLHRDHHPHWHDHHLHSSTSFHCYI